MFKILLIASIFLFVISFLSCSKKEYTEVGIKQISHTIDSLLYTAVGESFDWGSADSYSSFYAYFSDSVLVFINEKLNSRSGGGESINWYYIYKNNAVQYVEKRLEIVSDAENHKRKSILNMTVQITPSGDVLNYDKIINGQRKQLSGEESDWIYKHSKELINIVKKHSKILKRN